MQRIIAGLAMMAALGLLAAGANFGCSQGSSAGKTESGYCLLPPAANAPGGAAAGKVAASGATVNHLCPINGAPFNPNDVPDVLVRYYKGMKVGFCCGGHPEMWDKLSDAEKDAKLAEVMGK